MKPVYFLFALSLCATPAFAQESAPSKQISCTGKTYDGRQYDLVVNYAVDPALTYESDLPYYTDSENLVQVSLTASFNGEIIPEQTTTAIFTSAELNSDSEQPSYSFFTTVPDESGWNSEATDTVNIIPAMPFNAEAPSDHFDYSIHTPGFLLTGTFDRATCSFTE